MILASALVSIATELAQEGFKLQRGSDREVVSWLRVGKCQKCCLGLEGSSPDHPSQHQ